MGPTGRVLTTLDYPRKAIVSIADGEGRPQTIVESGEVYFWHAGVSEDGQWIVSDSNWPDRGIFLINARTGRVRKLCNDGSSKTYQMAHPHPAFSPDGSNVVFNSDRYGFPHVFLAKITDAFKEALISASG
jgi:Tol biopolymer transport system component